MASAQLIDALDSRKTRVALVAGSLPLLIAATGPPRGHLAPFIVGVAVAVASGTVVNTLGRRVTWLWYLAVYGGLLGLFAMQANTGGIASGYTILLLPIVIFFATEFDDVELGVGLALVALLSVLPMLAVGTPAYPVSWTNAALVVTICLIVAGALRELTRETVALKHRLEDRAARDPLTGLLNRGGWDDRAEDALALAERTDRTVAIALIDLDGFKAINDTRGHDVGDRLLRDTARRMRTELRAADVIARIGGDEFAVLLTGRGLDDHAAGLARLASVTPAEGAFSAGLAVRQPGEPLAAALARADVAMYAAKSRGGSGLELAPLPVPDTVG